MQKAMQNNQQIMGAAWALFRQTYGNAPFRSIGRSCFAWALRETWRREREARRVAAIPANVKAAQIAHLTNELGSLEYRGDFRTAQHRRREIRCELDTLAA